ncbi:porin [Erwinia endophytica]|uniref:YfaZ family outer membrane protein n=1 Tax=Erwinia endophytica TaxID=1563158 RepID=UPI001265E884|nr:YfaZ family outer membrane protein [Erwinia endophytica]KAB8308277.1 porin [Erwinia endophytica]
MKKLALVAISALVITSTSAMAMGVSLEQGKNFTNLNAEMGKDSGGLFLDGNWVKNTDDGVQVGSVGTGYNLDLGPVMLSAGMKAAYIGPKKGDNGVAFPIGGGVRIALPADFAIYGEGYSAPRGLNNSVKNYVEADGGVSWSPVAPLTVKAGYRHASVDGKNGRPSHTLIDGPFIGAGMNF